MHTACYLYVSINPAWSQ